jgi:hypothetical protein
MTIGLIASRNLALRNEALTMWTRAKAPWVDAFSRGGSDGSRQTRALLGLLVCAERELLPRRSGNPPSVALRAQSDGAAGPTVPRGARLSTAARPKNVAGALFARALELLALCDSFSPLAPRCECQAPGRKGGAA